jgi:hypothetical protein
MQAKNVHINAMDVFLAFTMVHQIMTELAGAATEKENRPLKIIACSANGIGRQGYKVRKQLQGLRMDVALFSETQLKPCMGFDIPKSIYQTDREDRHKGPTAIAVNKGITHTCIDLPPFLSVEATGVCIPIGNTYVFLAVVSKSTQRLWTDTHITELLGFRNKYILAGDLNAKFPLQE